MLPIGGYWKETGDLSVWKGIAQDALIMNIDDLLCVGVTDNIMLSSTIGRNKSLISGDVLSSIINGTEELLLEYKKYGINIISTGGETADVGDIVRTLDVGFTTFARIKKEEVIDLNIVDPTQFNKESKYFDPKSKPNNPRWDCVKVKYIFKSDNILSLPELKNQTFLPKY